MPRLEIYLFGLPHILLGGNPINLKNHKAMGLIAYLAIHNKPQSREALASIFWPDDDPSIASGSLRTTLWRINKSGLKPWLKVDRVSVGINFSNNLFIDAVHFNNLIVNSINHGHSPSITCNKCITILEEIVEIYHNGFMRSYFIKDSSQYEEWQLFQQERMRFLFSSAIGRLVEAYRIREDMNNALTYTQYWLTIDPYHDEGNRLLMQLYLDVGQRESALKHYDDYVRILKRDLKISPDETITRIYHQITSGISKSKSPKRGFPSGVILHVNFSSITSSQDTKQKCDLEILSNYTNNIKNIISRYGGKIFNVRVDSISSLFINGDPLNCALLIHSEHISTLGEYLTVRAPSILINTIKTKTILDFLNEQEIKFMLDINPSTWEGQILITSQVLAKYDLPNGAYVIDYGIHTSNITDESIHILGLTKQPSIDIHSQSPHSLTRYHHNLPFQTTPFIGREYEISLISLFIQNPNYHIISLIGPGGIGKTRLAIQVAAQQTDRFIDGIYYLSINTFTKPEQFFGQLSDAFNFRLSDQGKPADQIIDYLVGKQILLVIDNFENLIDGPGILIDFIHRSPALKIILTSRKRLNLKLEWAYNIQGLSYPQSEKDEDVDILNFSACKLFIQSAMRVNPEFNPDGYQKKCIAQICRIVGGSPLAIELAAAWVRSLTCSDIIEHIKTNLDFLSGSMLDLPDRHRSLKAVFDQSWSLLSEEEQQVLSRLSIFMSSFCKVAAEEIANAPIWSLASCVDKSMLKYCLDGRYEIPETIRYFAEERLNDCTNEKDVVVKEFCKYYGTFCIDSGVKLLGHEQLSTLENVRQEIRNITHAWNLVLQTSNYHELEQFIDTVYLYHEIKCLYHDGSEYFRKALDAITQFSESEFEPLKIRLQARLGCFLFHLGFYDEGLKHLEEKLPLAREKHFLNETVYILTQLGDAYRMIGEFDQALEYISECITMCEGEDIEMDPHVNFCYAQALLELGALHITRNQPEQAKKILLRSTEEFERAGNLWWVAKAYGSLSYVYARLEDYAESKLLREKNLAISKKTGDKRGVAVALNNLAGILEKLGESDRMIELLSESLKISQSIGDRRFASIVMQNLAQAYLELNSDFFEAEKYFMESIDTFKTIGDKRGLVYALNNYACALLDRDDLVNARYYCRESLRAALSIKETSILLYILSSITRLFYKSGDYEKTAELCGYLKNHPEFDSSASENVLEVIRSLQDKVTDPEYILAFERGKSKKLDYFIDNV